MNQNQELEQLADELGIELNVNENTEFNLNTDRTSEMETVEIQAVQPFQAGQGTVRNETRKQILPDGTQFKFEIRHRPQCPSCNYVPAGDNEANHLLAHCTECGNQTCPSCNQTCEACGTTLCHECTSGHGLEYETLCKDCVGDVEEEVRFRREKELREQEQKEIQKAREQRLQEERLEREFEHKKRKQELEEQKKKREYEWQKKKERENLDIKRQQKRFENKLQAKELLLKIIKQKKEVEEKRSFKDKRTASHIEEINNTQKRFDR